MARTTRNSKLVELLFVFILAIIPFGQLPGVAAKSFLNAPIRVHALDVLVALAAILAIGLVRINWRATLPLLSIFVFGIVYAFFSLSVFDHIGLSYLLRLTFYSLFYLLLREWIQGDDKRAQTIVSSLLIAGVVTAIFGWVQYSFFPDLRDLVYVGWDDHYFRLAGSMLDPAFAAIVLVLAAIIGLRRFEQKNSFAHLLAVLFLVLSLGFTYSRAGFLALLAALLYYFFKRRALSFLVAAYLVIIISLLPGYMGGEGVNLFRTASTVQKYENYSQSLKIISESPVFGVGYNNICKVKQVLGINTEKQANSCYGLDNSILFIVATTGFLGLFVIVKLGLSLWRNMTQDDIGQIWKMSMIAILVHSMFTNTLVHPWVLAWMAMLSASAISRRIK